MNLKKIIDYAHTLRDFEGGKSDVQCNLASGSKLYEKEKEITISASSPLGTTIEITSTTQRPMGF